MVLLSRLIAALAYAGAAFLFGVVLGERGELGVVQQLFTGVIPAVTVLLAIFTKPPGRPYVLFTGLAMFAGVSAEQRFSASAGIGVKVPMSRALSFRFEGRGYYTALEDDDECTFCDYFYNQDFYQGEVNAGLVFSF